MTIYAQCGFGKSDKVERGLSSGALAGVILSPRDEHPDKLESFITKLRKEHLEADILFDPQFYATTIGNPRDGKLPEYEYYKNHCNLGRTDFRPRAIASYVRDALDYQVDLSALDYLISPTVHVDDFRDPWSQIALSMAEEAQEYSTELSSPPSLLVSVVISEGALRNRASMNEYLDALTSLEVEGFYLIVSRQSLSYQLGMEATSLENLLYLTYVLGAVNEYTLVVGYTDWLGLLLHAAGATNTACGWYQNLRQFSLSRFKPSTGGRRPRPKYSSGPLLNSVLLFPELEDVYQGELIGEVLSGTSHDHLVADGPAIAEANWSDSISCCHHWETISQIASALANEESVEEGLEKMTGLIRDAETLYERLHQRNIYFENPAYGYLSEWRYAINGFRDIIEL